MNKKSKDIIGFILFFFLFVFFGTLSRITTNYNIGVGLGFLIGITLIAVIYFLEVLTTKEKDVVKYKK